MGAFCAICFVAEIYPIRFQLLFFGVVVVGVVVICAAARLLSFFLIEMFVALALGANLL